MMSSSSYRSRMSRRDTRASRIGAMQALVFLTLVVALAACSRPAVQAPGVGAAAPSSTAAPSGLGSLAPATPGPAVAIPAALRGTWIAKVAGTTATSGAWTLKGTARNLELQNPIAGSDPFALDPSAISATTLTLPADAGCPDQAAVTTGEYTWAITAGTLTFTKVKDSCGDRSGVLTASSWTRKP